MTADTIAKVLGGRQVGGGWLACCPSHADNNPSLSIREADDGRLLVHCHAGCEQAQVIVALRSRGLWPYGDQRRRTTIRPQSLHYTHAPDVREDAARIASVTNLSSFPARGWDCR
jgi:hypothetical protein